MNRLIERLGNAVKGVLTGFDRIVFKGSILPVCYADGVMDFLHFRGVLNKDYKKWMLAQTNSLIEGVNQYALKHCGEGIAHMTSWRTDKEKLAKERQAAKRIESGLIGAWSFLESGRSFRAHYCAATGYPQLRSYQTACKHIYLYLDHKQYGFMNVRIQTWFPYHIQICMNGRQWLGRSLEKGKIDFLLNGNKFHHVDDYTKAQRLLDTQMDSRWPDLLNNLLPMCFPTMRQSLGPDLGYYWTLWQSEWATDMIFNSPADLKPTMESLIRHAMLTNTGTRVLQYMGRPITKDGKPHAASCNEVSSRLLNFYDGVRLRHWVDQNSVKIYNEHNVLRSEVTINTPDMFKVYRNAQGETAEVPKKLRPLRKGVADIAIRAKVSQEINDRFMNGVATFTDETSMRELFSERTKSKVKSGRRIRALDPTGKDRELLEAISDPADVVAGLSNVELRERLRSSPWGAGRTDAQLAARISRHLRLLRDHGLIRKIPNRRRYNLTDEGRTFVTALSAMLGASTKQLMAKAA